MSESLRLFPAILITLLLHNSVGFIIIHIYQVAEIKSEILESIKTNTFQNNLTVLIFSKDELDGELSAVNRLNNEELRYEGRYYDIVKEEVKGEKIYFYCLYDEKESFLDLLFSNHLEKQNGNSSSQKLISGFPFKFLPDYILNNKYVPLENHRLNHCPAIAEKIILTNYPEILTPPPQGLNIT